MTNLVEQIVLAGESKLAGRFRMEVINGLTGEIKEDTDWYGNLLTDLGLNYMLTTNQGFYYNCNYCQVGSSSITPQFSDIACTTPIGTMTTDSDNKTYGNSGTPNYYTWFQVRFKFAQGQIVGNVTEVALHYGGANTAINHALIVDGSGNPTTISLTSTDILYVYYEIRAYPVLTDVDGTVVLNSISYPYKIRSANVNSPFSYNYVAQPRMASSWTSTAEDNTLQAASGTYPAGPWEVASSFTDSIYISNSFIWQTKFNWLPTQSVYTTGIGSIIVAYNSAYPGFVMNFSTKIPKTNLQILNFTFRQTFSRL